MFLDVLFNSPVSRYESIYKDDTIFSGNDFITSIHHEVLIISNIQLYDDWKIFYFVLLMFSVH